MNNALISDLLTLLAEESADTDRLHFKYEAEAGRALYYTHAGRITTTGRRLRISAPYERARIEQEDTVFTASGLKYPYPGSFSLPDTYARDEAAMAAATFAGKEDPATAGYLARQAGDREGLESLRASGKTLIFPLAGLAGFFSIASDTLAALDRIRTLTRAHGGDDTVRAYTQPHKGFTLVTLTVGDIWIQFMPMPVPPEVAGGNEVWRIDNPQKTLA